MTRPHATFGGWEFKAFIIIATCAVCTILLLGINLQDGSATDVGSTRKADPESTQHRLSRLEEEVATLRQSQNKLVRLEDEMAKLRLSLQEPPNAQGPTVMVAGGSLRARGLVDRLHFLERKFSGMVNWLPDPQLWRRKQYSCKKESDWGTNDDMRVCLDGWERRAKARAGRPCVVYDLGIRAQPSFGRIAATQFGCKVAAYDPSPTTQAWWDGNSDEVKALKALGESKYKLWAFAAGGTDGPLELFEYNWQQVSIFKEEHDTSLSDNMKKLHPMGQKSFNLPAKTLPAMMLDNRDTFIDVLKIDIEGSEYMFLQDIFDRLGCPPAQQITLEYHHFHIDERYGSSPEVNTMHTLLNDCGFKSFYVRESWRSKVEHADDKFYLSPKRYSMASYCKDCE